MDYAQQRAVLQASKLVHARWYEQGYPDVVRLGLHPIDHYLRIGAALGRNPSSRFDTRFYLNSNPSARASHLNPLVHYILHGRNQGLACLPEGAGGSVDGGRMNAPIERAQVLVAKRAFWELGLNDAPLKTLHQLATGAEDATARAMAACAVGHIALRRETPQGAQEALDWFALAYRDAPDLPFRRALRVTEILAHHVLDQPEAGRHVYDAAVLTGEADADTRLACTTLATDESARLFWINTVLAEFALPELALIPRPEGQTKGLSAYDRLTCSQLPEPVTEGPLVTVLIAAFQAEATLPTALRAMTEQTWRNLEILVLDDTSPDPGTAQVAQHWAARDPRVRLIRMAQNGGAYVARNHGLAQAKGAFVTLHDADDWAHPLRIEHQMRHLLEDSRRIGCLSRQARLRDDLRCTRWTGEGQFLLPNTSSHLFRRDVILRDFGGWDRLRISADTELIRRIRHAHGRASVTELPGGPLAFQRDSGSSAVNDPVLGINGLHYGARRAYAEAQAHHRAFGGNLKYDTERRPFPVPAILRHDRPPRDKARALPVVVAVDWREDDAVLSNTLTQIDWHKQVGLGLGLVELYRHQPDALTLRTSMADRLRACLDGGIVQHLVYGEWIACDLLILRDPTSIAQTQRYLPHIEARQVRIIIDRPPIEPGWPDMIDKASKNIAAWLGAKVAESAIWHAADPMIRAALADISLPGSVALTDTDWPDLLPKQRIQTTHRSRARLTLGRHMPDAIQYLSNPLADLNTFGAVRPDINIRLLASGKIPTAWGSTPDHIEITEIGSEPVETFLATLDLWVALAGPDAGPPRRQTILQAMAAGIPVMLHPIWKPVFGPAAIYISPDTPAETILTQAEAFLRNPEARVAQQTSALTCLHEHSPEMAYASLLRHSGIASRIP